MPLGSTCNVVQNRSHSLSSPVADPSCAEAAIPDRFGTRTSRSATRSPIRPDAAAYSPTNTPVKPAGELRRSGSARPAASPRSLVPSARSRRKCTSSRRPRAPRGPAARANSRRTVSRSMRTDDLRAGRSAASAGRGARRGEEVDSFIRTARPRLAVPRRRGFEARPGDEGGGAADGGRRSEGKRICRATVPAAASVSRPRPRASRVDGKRAAEELPLGPSVFARSRRAPARRRNRGTRAGRAAAARRSTTPRSPTGAIRPPPAHGGQQRLPSEEMTGPLPDRAHAEAHQPPLSSARSTMSACPTACKGLAMLR